MFEQITETQWAAGYTLVSLSLWLLYEMSGAAAKAAKDPIKGHYYATVVVLLWGPVLLILCAILCVILPLVGISLLLGKARESRIL